MIFQVVRDGEVVHSQEAVERVQEDGPDAGTFYGIEVGKEGGFVFLAGDVLQLAEDGGEALTLGKIPEGIEGLDSVELSVPLIDPLAE